MTGRIAITGWGYIDETGFGNARSARHWEGAAPRPEDLRWKMVSKRPCSRFGRLDVMSRYALIAVELLDQCVPEGGLLKSDTAIVLATELGSLGVDCQFFQSAQEAGGASPALFSYTLPSMAIAEIAIRYGLTGPNLCLMTSLEDCTMAFWEAVHLITRGEVDRCLALACDAFPQSVASELNRVMPGTGRGANQAFACLMEALGATRARSSQGYAEVRVVTDNRAHLKGPSGSDMAKLRAFLTSREARATTIRAPASCRGIGNLYFTRSLTKQHTVT